MRINATSSCSACSGTTIRPCFALVCAGLALLLSAGAFAQSSPGRFELTPYGGFRFGGDFDGVDGDATADLDDDVSFGLIANLRESANTQWELIYARQSTTADTAEFNAIDPTIAPSVDLDIHNFHLGRKPSRKHPPRCSRSLD